MSFLLASTSLPTSIVDNLDFKSFVFHLNPRFSLPGRTRMTTDIIQIHQHGKKILNKMIHSALSKKILTADIWSKKGLTSSYLGVTIHFVGSDSVLRSAVLELIHFPSPHTGKAVAESIENTVKEWGLGHIPIIITDSGSNMVKAFKEAKRSYAEDLLESTIELVATNTIPQDPVPARVQQPTFQQSKQSENGDDDEILADDDFIMLWGDDVDNEEGRQENTQAAESAETEGIQNESDHREPIHQYNDAEDLLTPEMVDGEEIDYCEEERQIEELLLRFQSLGHRQISKKKIKRYSCLCHLLQLVMASFDKLRTKKQREGSSIPLFSAAIQAARKLVGRFNKSTVATSRLKELCNKKLVADVTTRWSSIYLLIHRLLKLRDHVQIVCEELNWDCLSNSEWNLISRIEKLLEPFASYTQLVSADLMPTFSSVIPCVEELKFHLIEVRLWHLAYVLVSIFKNFICLLFF